MILKTWLTRRWLGYTVALLLLLAAFTWLGFWQLGVAYAKGRNEELTRTQSYTPVAIDEVVRPGERFPDSSMNRPVLATGSYEPDKQQLVPERRLDGVDGYWVLVPLKVSASGARLIVVRGFVTDPAQATKPATTPVTVHGSLAQPEGQPERFDLPTGQIGSVDPGTLLNEWGGSIYTAFVFAQREDPDLLTGSAVKRVPPPELANPGVNWRNFFYAVQWWLFGVVAIYVFVRVLREEARGERGPDATLSAGTPQQPETQGATTP